MIDKVVKYIAGLRDREQKVKSFFISFYIIGFIGMIIPFSFPLFLKLTPFALILSFSSLMLFHKEKADNKTALVLTGIFIAGYIIEVIGVNKGFVFGEYHYGSGLGLKLWHTPLLIGMNWVLLVYLSSGLVELLKLKAFPSVILSSLVMLGYDLIMEQVAPYLDLWHWKNVSVPLQNYIAWFIIALSFQIVLKIFRVNTSNKMTLLIFGCQTVFFILLFIFFSLTK
jgi:bisanhydrobacterioruberin hydratase